MTQLGLALFAKDAVRRASEPKEGTQEYAILRALRAGDRLTPADSKERFGTMRLGARIYDLKKAGFDIQTKMVKVGPRTMIAEYWMER